MEAVERVIRRGEYGRLGIPKGAHRVIERAWEEDPPAIYGRFDLNFDGSNPPKLLEYNADTPTSLLEAAVIQWHWLQEEQPDSDQFNLIWEALVNKWKCLAEEGYCSSGEVHFACVGEPEDLMTTAVMVDTAQEAGLKANLLNMKQIGWDTRIRRFVDAEHKPIETCFKLYPWEWMLREEFGDYALESYGTVQWIEPIWKAILSNKGILAILWEMAPDHPNLLPAYFENPGNLGQHVRKPFLGREGANVRIELADEVIETSGPYGHGRFVYQGFAALPAFEGNHAVVGSWVIDGEACGIGIRESDGPITGDLARFVPHYFVPCVQSHSHES